MPLADDRVRSRLRGITVSLLAPFDDDLEIRHDKLEANVKSLFGNDVSSFLAATNISEYHSLSQQERVDAMETTADAFPDGAYVLANVGGSTEATADLMEAYDRIDVDAMMVMPLDHTYVHERRLIHYYEKLNAATDTPLVPYVRGFDSSVSFPHDLSRIEGVVDVKYTTKNPVKPGSAVAITNDDVVWVDSLAESYAVSFWDEGIEGFSAGISNFRPRVGLALFEVLTEESWERTRKIRDLMLSFQALRGKTGTDNGLPGAISVPIVKEDLELAGLYGGEVCKPIRPLLADDKRRAEKLYEELDDGIARVID